MEILRVFIMLMIKSTVTLISVKWAIYNKFVQLRKFGESDKCLYEREKS